MNEWKYSKWVEELKKHLSSPIGKERGDITLYPCVFKKRNKNGAIVKKHIPDLIFKRLVLRNIIEKVIFRASIFYRLCGTMHIPNVDENYIILEGEHKNERYNGKWFGWGVEFNEKKKIKKRELGAISINPFIKKVQPRRRIGTKRRVL